MTDLDRAILATATEHLSRAPWSRTMSVGEFYSHRDALAAHIQDSISEWLGEQQRVAGMNVAAE